MFITIASVHWRQCFNYNFACSFKFLCCLRQHKTLSRWPSLSPIGVGRHGRHQRRRSRHSTASRQRQQQSRKSATPARLESLLPDELTTVRSSPTAAKKANDSYQSISGGHLTTPPHGETFNDVVSKVAATTNQCSSNLPGSFEGGQWSCNVPATGGQWICNLPYTGEGDQ